MPNLFRVLGPNDSTATLLIPKDSLLDHLKRFNQLFKQLLDARGGAAVALDFTILSSASLAPRTVWMCRVSMRGG